MLPFKKLADLNEYLYPTATSRKTDPENHATPETATPSDQTQPTNNPAEAIAESPPPTPTPSSQLQSLIQSDRHPPGQRALFAAIDALRLSLSHDDALLGLQTAHELLRETLEDAIAEPSLIQGREHVREKLKREYEELPEEVPIEEIVMAAVVEGIKEWVGRRWRVEAMGWEC